ncbi:ArsA family ATPase [Streptomonospora sp. PA3]|uniref:ArsA family ATPase n=1 Tax=Streptomonospora sp. PA3 TaxID=2607326 RepID=UPI0012DE3171|nr:ArsA family ATPase [Streptomonospora sp. PA3]MUL44109.1 ArsA family ATPase [Streptomonospora sp. PA3]
MSAESAQGRGRAAARFDVDGLLADRGTRIVVCCGAGGVGKTTTAAAMGVRAAEAGRDAVVITVDPARRLAQSMGLRELDNTPRPVELPETGRGAVPGSLHAMMLDMKRTFDEIVEAHADPERARQILANPFYQSLSSSFSGTQEYMAMEKLGQLRESGDWDLIIVDTPPSRSALDFLDAPERLGRFLDSRLIRILGAPPATGAFRVLGAGVGMVTGVIAKIVGAQVLKDVQSFVAAFDAVFGGFQERAERTYRLLQERGTGFVVVAAPEDDALREAEFFIERLRDDRMPLAGIVLNRVHRTAVPDLPEQAATAAAAELDRLGDHALAAAALRLHAEQARVQDREQWLMDRLAAAHPEVPAAEVPARPEDVHDLVGLAEIGRALGEG